FVAALVDRCPRVRLLVTSRSPLHLAAERRYDVPPLPTPGPAPIEAPDPDPAALAHHGAVALFVVRAQAVQAGFGLPPGHAVAAGDLCRRLDGLPLAIELAAARTRLFPPQELLRRLADQLALLTGGPRDRAPRHQTLRAAIDWSYALLAPQAQ